MESSREIKDVVQNSTVRQTQLQNHEASWRIIESRRLNFNSDHLILNPNSGSVQRIKKNFRTCVLTSGLVTPAELDQAIVTLWTERSGGGTAQQVEIAEKELADRLVELGKLTPWQSSRLLAG